MACVLRGTLPTRRPAARHLPPTQGLRRMKLPLRSRLSAAAAAFLAATPLSPSPGHYFHLQAAVAADSDLPSSALLTLIPAMPSGAPATNATLPSDVVASIEAKTAQLERDFGRTNTIKDKNLNGSWRLLYSDGREITSLARGFPGGFDLGPTYQPIDLATGRFENQGGIVNKFGLASLSTCVFGDVSAAPAGSLNAAGVVNDRGNRIDVNFERITFSLDKVLGRPSTIRKVIVPNQKPGAAQPANDITYLDPSVRVTRGGDGALFIFRREESPRPLLTFDEREVLFADGAQEATLIGAVDGARGAQTEQDAPAEIKRLLEDPKR